MLQALRAVLSNCQAARKNAMSLQDTQEPGQPRDQKNHDLKARIAAQRAKAAAQADEIARKQAEQAEHQARAAGLTPPQRPVDPPQPPTPSAADVPAPESQEPPAPAEAGPVLSRQWPSAKRGIPSALVRCALFAGIQRSRGRIVGGSALPWVSGGLMLRRGGVGAEWTQYDLSVLLQLVQIANEYGHFSFGVDEMLTLLGIKPGPSTREALKQSLERLMGVLRIDMEDEEWLHRGYFSLLPRFTWSTRRHAGDKAPKCLGKLAPEFMALYLYGNVTRIDWSQRLALPAGFAQWLHAFYSSHKQPRPIQAAALANWAGLSENSPPYEVNRQVRIALEALQSVGFLSSFDVSRAGLVTVERAAR